MVQMFQLGARSTTPSASIEGNFPQQQFGFSVAISGSLLIVGSPGFSLNTSTFVGKLDSFDFPLASTHAVWSRPGDQPFARFGMSISVAPVSDGSPPIVAVGQPHRKCAIFFFCFFAHCLWYRIIFAMFQPTSFQDRFGWRESRWRCYAGCWSPRPQPRPSRASVRLKVRLQDIGQCNSPPLQTSCFFRVMFTKFLAKIRSCTNCTLMLICRHACWVAA